MPTKAEIIRAVQHQAAVNGGAPLGKDRFQSLTGIPEHAWAGKYWVRWNDLLEEAGFAPNEWNQRVHDDQSVLRRLAELARELGHFPTVAEKNFRARNEPGFPYDTTFRNYLGNQSAQAEALATFALTTPEYRDVYDLCQAVSKRAPSPRSKPDVAPSVVGRVYLINQRGSDQYKIGESEDPERRRRELQTGTPEQLDLVHVLETDDPKGIERYWHRRFESRPRRGEWFVLGEGDVLAFKRRGAFM